MSSKYTFLVVCTVGLLAIAADVSLSWTSPVYPKLYSNDTSINPLPVPITEEEDGWIGSLVTIGAIIGPFPFGFITEKWGRKLGLLATATPMIISSFCLAFIYNVNVIYIARTLAGMSMGGCYAILPLYVTEISQDHNRGRITQALNVFWCTGNFLSYCVGPFTSYKTFNLIIAVIPTMFFIMFILVGPESPYFLISGNRIEEAYESLMLLHGDNRDSVQRELDHIQKQVGERNEESGFMNIFRTKASRSAFIITSILVMTQELCGFCAILFYMQLIFESANTKLSADISSLIASFFLFISSFINIFIIDKVGRRILLITSCFGLALSLSLLGAFFYILYSTNFSTDPIIWLPLFSLIAFILSFNIGISCIPWTIASELFPNDCKQSGATAISCICWITSFIVTKFYNQLNNAIGKSGSFWLFAGWCLPAGIFCIFCVPETKGKSFNEIQDILQSENFFTYGFKKSKSVTMRKDP